ncbi:MAG: hypothetical protein K2W93_13855, partial [Burkholderiaceae bacterium]|nr:hypothetical protein [Burkholderiaceae bacterium]
MSERSDESPHPAPGGSVSRLRAQLPRLALALALLALSLPLAYRLFGPRGVEVQVQRKIWRLEIEVERQIAELGSAWCDELPAGAQIQSQRLVGAAVDAPATAAASANAALRAHCRYTVPTWRTLWQASRQGVDPEPPRWPEPELTQGTQELSRQRLGARHQFYELELVAANGQRWVCRQPL